MSRSNKITYMNELKDRIKAQRKALGLTQKQVAKFVGVSAVAVTQWEQGTNTPKPMVLLAKVLKCSVMWLEFGKGDILPSNVEPVFVINNNEYPVISWVQAGEWSPIEITNIADAKTYRCPVKCSEHTFILKVIGISMLPKFTEGSLIFVDPLMEATSGKYVIARLNNENSATFKQLIIEDDRKFLKPLNPDWPDQITPINGECAIVGVVIFAGQAV